MTLRNQALTGLIWSALEKWGGKATNLLVFLILARLLDPETFGLIALAMVFVALVNVFVDQGFADALVQREDLDPEHLDSAFWTNLGLSVLMSVAAIVAAPLVSTLLGEPELAPVLRWLSLAIPLRALCGVQDAQFRRDLQFRILSIRSLTALSVGGAVGIGMAIEGYGVWSLIGQQLTRNAVEAIVLWVASSWRPAFRFSKTHFTDLFGFGVNVLGTNLLNFLNRRSDDLLIGAFLGSTALGYYSVAYKILRAVTDLVASVGSRVAFPAFSRMQGDTSRMRWAFYEVTGFASLIAFPLFGGLAASAPIIIPLFFGAQWEASVPVMQILSLIGILHTLFYFNSNVILANGKAAWRLWINLLNAVANVGAFAIAVRWGIEAVAIAYVARGYLLAPVPLWAIHKLISIDVRKYLTQCIVPAMGTAVLIMVVISLTEILATRVSPTLLILIHVFAGGSAYVATVYLVSSSTMERVRNLFHAVRNA